MAMVTNLCRLPSVIPSPISKAHLWKFQRTTRRRAACVSSYAADAASYSSQSIPKLPSTPKQKSVAGVDQNNLVDPWLLADQDSRFAELFGVQLHYKIAHPPSDDESAETNSETENGAMAAKKVGVPAVLLHGFGASLYSWQKVLKPLAAILGSSAVAFDRPAFGLTGRPKLSHGKEQEIRRRNPFGLEFSAKVTLSFVEFLHAQQIILIGHSAGSLVALQAYFDAPERVAAIILIAPAVTAPLIIEEVKKATTAPGPEEDQKVERENPNFDNNIFSAVVQTARDAIWWALMQVVKVVRIIKAAVQALFQTVVPEKIGAQVGSAVRSVRERLVTAIFRSALATWAVRIIMDRFGIRGVRLAFCDPKKVDDAVLHGYTKPLRCKDWDRALLEFVLAMAVGPGASIKARIPLGKRLKEVTCPVLVVTGDTDRLVPAWNARRLASALPNAEFELIKNCGHMPQEETPDELLRIIERFFARKFSLDSTSEFIPVPTL